MEFHSDIFCREKKFGMWQFLETWIVCTNMSTTRDKIHPNIWHIPAPSREREREEENILRWEKESKEWKDALKSNKRINFPDFRGSFKGAPILSAFYRWTLLLLPVAIDIRVLWAWPLVFLHHGDIKTHHWHGPNWSIWISWTSLIQSAVSTSSWLCIFWILAYYWKTVGFSFNMIEYGFLCYNYFTSFSRNTKFPCYYYCYY